MGGERLTRQELGWLLAQEARGAARSLRADLVDRSAAPLARVRAPDAARAVPVEHSLDALDEALNSWSQLEPSPSRGRRGRIDLAALLYELAPNCRISIEPGAGTEVVGEERLLRRMLQLLLAQNASTASDTTASNAISVRREQAWIHVAVELGPDTVAANDMERRWLSRMALRLGGRFELQGRRQSIVLPAETSGEAELEALRDELEQARLLGEAYARELAEAFTSTQSRAAKRPAPAVATLRAAYAALLPTLSAISTSLDDPRTAELARSELGELRANLRAFVELRSNEQRQQDLRRSLQSAVACASESAARRGVELDVSATETDWLRAAPEALDLLLRSLLEHALGATRAGQRVLVRLCLDDATVRVETVDSGPMIPPSTLHDLLNHQIDPASLGRPRGHALLLAHALSHEIGGRIEVVDDGDGRTITRWVIARSSRPV